MRKLLLITLSALIIASGFFVLTGNEAFAAFTENKKCYNASDGTREIIDQEKWQRYVKVSVPIPGVTKELVCLGTQEPNVDIEVDRYYYATDLGSYLAGFYEFFVSIVGIMAAVMILYAGIQWVLAAGNQSRIQSAKNIIFSAVIGVVIAFTSYLLLFLLNPALINYDSLNASLTSVSGIEQKSFASCGGLSDQPTIPIKTPAATILFPEVVGNYGTYGINLIYADILTGDEDPLITPANRISCGDSAKLISDGGATTCQGSYCGVGGGFCIPDSPECVNGYIGGTLEHTSNAYVDSIYLEGLCNDYRRVVDPAGSGSQIRIDTSESDKHYSFVKRLAPYATAVDTHVQIQEFVDWCDGYDGFAGFYLNVSINDDQGAAFNLFPTVDDNFAVGKCEPGKLASVISSYTDPKDLTVGQWAIAHQEGRFFNVSDFYTKTPYNYENLKTDPFKCNFKIDRISFPAR